MHGIEIPASGGESPSRRLIGVIPVAQAAFGDRFMIIIDALMCFDADVLLNIHLRFSPSHDFVNYQAAPFTSQPITVPPWPQPLLTVSDDLGTGYRSRPHGGSATQYLSRHEMGFLPGIPAAAQRLTLTIEAISWEDSNTGAEVRRTSGPWVFEVGLATMVPARLAPRPMEDVPR
jgi:hypothetical protein